MSSGSNCSVKWKSCENISSISCDASDSSCRESNSTDSYESCRTTTRVKRVTTDKMEFISPVTPVGNFHSNGGGGCNGSCGGNCNGNCGGNCLPLKMSRINGTIFLQWPRFSGHIAANGSRYLIATQSIPSLPRQEVTLPVWMRIRGVTEHIGKVIIDPYQIYGGGNMAFLLPSDVVMGDHFEIDGGCVNWLCF